MPKPDVYLIQNELGDLEYYVCPSNLANKTNLSKPWIVKACAAGCNTQITYPKGLRKTFPKVCTQCDIWLSNCVGEA